MKWKMQILALAGVLACCAGCPASEIPTTLAQRPALHQPLPPVAYWREQRASPRPMRIHVLRVNLRSNACVPVVLIAADPDGDGPAESQLEKPLPFARRAGVVAAINANAFQRLPSAATGAKHSWSEHAAVDIIGWAKSAEREASKPQRFLPSFWIDAEGRGHVGDASAATSVRLAVAGFGSLVRDGVLVDTETKPLHPRTALGVSRDGWTLWLVVVDGRQPGASEGMTTGELAVFLKELGGRDAMNLDGGGSSILLFAADGTKLAIMNRPSDFATRPVPVMLGLRLRR